MWKWNGGGDESLKGVLGGQTFTCFSLKQEIYFQIGQTLL